MCSAGSAAPAAAQVRGDLHEAADVAGGHCLRAGRADGLGLARAERGGDVGVLDVVEAGRPAARVAVGNLHHAQVRHGCQQRPRRPADALRVREMAGVVVRDGQRLAQRGRRDRSERVEEFGDVAHARRRTARSASSCARPRNAWPYSFIADPHPAALVTIASTSVGKRTGQRVCPRRRRDRASPLCSASAPQQPWPGGHHHLDAVGRKHAQRRQRDVRRERLLHAPGQQRHTRALRACAPRRCAWQRHGRRQPTGQQCRASIAARAGSSVRRAWPSGPGAREPGTAPATRACRAGAGAAGARSATRAPVSRPARNGHEQLPVLHARGHAVTQPRQPRQRSMCGCASASVRSPSSTSFISTMRPRGESISSPSTWYVGHAGRQKPQCTHVATARAMAVAMRVGRIGWNGVLHGIRHPSRAQSACGSITERRRCSNGFGRRSAPMKGDPGRPGQHLPDEALLAQDRVEHVDRAAARRPRRGCRPRHSACTAAVGASARIQRRQPAATQRHADERCVGRNPRELARVAPHEPHRPPGEDVALGPPIDLPGPSLASSSASRRAAEPEPRRTPGGVRSMASRSKRARCTAAISASADARSPASTRTVACAVGAGNTLKVSSATTPRRPQLPTIAWCSRKPAAFFTTLPPLCDDAPFAVDEARADQEVANAAEAIAARAVHARSDGAADRGARRSRGAGRTAGTARAAASARSMSAMRVPASAVNVHSSGVCSTMPASRDRSSTARIAGAAREPGLVPPPRTGQRRTLRNGRREFGDRAWAARSSCARDHAGPFERMQAV